MVETSARKKIAILLPDLRPGGAERLHLALAREWLRHDIDVEFVLRQAGGELLAQLPIGATVVDLGAPRVRHAFLPLVRYLRRMRPGALLAAMWPLTAIAPLATRLARFGGAVAVSEHSPLSRAYAGKGNWHHAVLRATTALGYRLADVRIGVSDGVAADMAVLSWLPRDGVVVVHNPAASGAVAGRIFTRPASLQDVSGPVVLSVGTLKPVKRHDLLIDAFARLPDAQGTTLCILGEGAQREAIERQVAELGLANRVLLPGFVADPAPWYAHANLFVLSSDYEGFGNVLVEAMEHGLPVVSTDCPSGPREILADGRFGRLVPTGDAEALSEAIQEALEVPGDRDALRARAADFAAEKIALRYLDLLLPGWKESCA